MSSGIHVYKKDQYTYDGHSTFVDESLRQNERGIGNDIDIVEHFTTTDKWINKRGYRNE